MSKKLNLYNNEGNFSIFCFIFTIFVDKNSMNAEFCLKMW
jgi:hypothetical protein